MQSQRPQRPQRAPSPQPIESTLPLTQTSNCCSSSTKTAVHNDLDWNEMHQMILQLDLQMSDKNLVLTRFRRIFGHIDGHYRTVQRYYNNSRMFVITASILNPALLSIASSDPSDTINVVLFWIVWTLQILVSLVTAYIAFFKWDKKYFVYMVHKQRVEQEIWTFLELTGKYGVVDPTCSEEVAEMKTSHRTKIKAFLSQLESIYRKLQDADASIQNVDGEDNAPSNTSSSQTSKPQQRGGFMQEVHHQQNRRLAATERKLAELTSQMNTTQDQGLRKTLSQDVERFKHVQQRNQVVGQQVREWEQMAKQNGHT